MADSNRQSAKPLLKPLIKSLTLPEQASPHPNTSDHTIPLTLPNHTISDPASPQPTLQNQTSEPTRPYLARPEHIIQHQTLHDLTGAYL